MANLVSIFPKENYARDFAHSVVHLRKLPMVLFYKEDGFERTLVITTISSRGRWSSLMAFPKTISDSPLEYTYNKKSVNNWPRGEQPWCQSTFAVSNVLIPASYLYRASTRNKANITLSPDLRSFDVFDWFIFRKNPSLPLRVTIWHASQDDFGYLQPGGPKTDCILHWCKWYLKRSTIDIPYGIVFLISDILDMPVVFSETRMWFRRENRTPWILPYDFIYHKNRQASRWRVCTRHLLY